MSADELRGRVDHDVRSVFDGAAEVGRRHGVVDDQRDAGFVGDFRHGLDIEHVHARIGDGFAVDGAGFRGDRLAEIFGIVGLDELDVDSEAAEADIHLGVSAAVKGAGGDQLVARAEQAGDGEELRSLSAGGGEPGHAAFEGGHALLEDIRRGIHDTAVNIAELLQREQVRGVLRVLEGERSRLINRHRAGVGRGVRVCPAQGLVANPSSRSGCCQAWFRILNTRKPTLTKVFADNERPFVNIAAWHPNRRSHEAELNILQVLWEGGPRSVRAIQHVPNEGKPTGYTTVLKMLQIMTEKGLVDRDETCGSRSTARYCRRTLSGGCSTIWYIGPWRQCEGPGAQALATKNRRRGVGSHRTIVGPHGGEGEMTPLLEAFRAALLHFMWQGCLVLALLWVTLFALRKRSANVRYVAGCVALAALAVAPLFTTYTLYQRPAAKAATFAAVVPLAARLSPTPAPAHQTPALALVQSWALPAWTLGVLLFSFRMVWGCAQVAALQRRGQAAGDELLRVIGGLSRRMGLAGPPRVLISECGDPAWWLAAACNPAAGRGASGLTPELDRAGTRTGVYPAARLPGELDPDAGGDAAVLSSGGMVISRRVRHERSFAATTWR